MVNTQEVQQFYRPPVRPNHLKLRKIIISCYRSSFIILGQIVQNSDKKSFDRIPPKIFEFSQKMVPRKSWSLISGTFRRIVDILVGRKNTSITTNYFRKSTEFTNRRFAKNYSRIFLLVTFGELNLWKYSSSNWAHFSPGLAN